MNELITRPLLMIVLLMIVSNFAAAVVGAVRLWDERQNVLARHIGLLLSAIAIQGICWIIGGTYLARPRPAAYRIWMMVGYSVPSIAVWRLVFYLGGKRK